MPESKTKLIEDDKKVLAKQPPTNVIPAVQQYVGIYKAGKNFYKNADIAYITSPENAWRMWYDISIQEPLQSRILTTAQLPGYIEPENARDPIQLERAAQIQKIIENTPQFLKLKIALLQAIWFGKAGVFVNYEFKSKDDNKYLSVKDWSPVFGDSIYFKQNSDAVAVLVSQGSGNPDDGTKDLTTESTDIGLAHTLTDLERESFVLHTHLHLAVDWHKYLQAGQVKGVGLRDFLYWTWYLKSETLGLLSEYMERVGLGITIYRYSSSNPESLKAVQTLAESQTTNMQIFWPYETEGEAAGGVGIERIEPSSEGMSNFMRIIDDYYGAQMKRFIVGQNLTSESGSTGLGSKLAEIHQDTFMKLIRLDALNLEQTLTTDFVRIIHKYSFPDDDFTLKYKITVDKPDPLKYVEAAKAFWSIGGSMDEDELREVLGLTKPGADSAILKRGYPTTIANEDGTMESTIIDDPKDVNEVVAPKSDINNVPVKKRGI